MQPAEDRSASREVAHQIPVQMDPPRRDRDIEPDASANQAEYEHVRQLLLGREQAQIARLERALQKRRSLSPSEVGDVLAQSVQHAVRRNPRPLADALFPVIGPALAKAVRSALGEMVQSLNQVAATSLSLRAWSWRWEALRTGRPFAEVALLRSLVFRVERVFLVHRPTGLLLAHVGAAAAQDTDLLSGMLTAIQDFVKDSFTGDESSQLDELQAGEHRIVVEQGPHAFVAAVVRGIAPAASLRELLRKVLSTLHGEFASDLAAFDGDNAAFSALLPHLEACLIEQRSFHPQAAARGRWAVLGLACLLIVALGGLSANAYSEHRRVSRYLDELRQRPGLVIIEVRGRGTARTVVGLRDPLADDPAHSPHPPGLSFVWQPYASLHTSLVLARAQAALRPPATLRLSIEGSTLVATGSAPHRFLRDLDRLGRLLPGVHAVLQRGVIDEDQQAIDENRRLMATLLLRFQTGSDSVGPEQQALLDTAALVLRRLHRSARALGWEADFTVVGRADSLGTEDANLALSQQRAQSVVDTLIARGIPSTWLHPRGVGTQAPLHRGDDPAGSADNRSVSFEATLSPESQATDQP